jgi:carnitine-CoA ligase
MITTTHDNLASFINDFVSSDPGRTALTFEGAEVRPDVVRRYQDLWNNGQALARGLRQQGIGPGSVVAVLMANHAEFVELMVAGALLRAALVPIDPRTKGEKLAFMVQNSRADAIIAADYALPNIESLGRDALSVDWIAALVTDEGPKREFWRSDVLDFTTLVVSNGSDLPVPSGIGEEVMQIIHTSGTTGDPKGIVLTHRRFCDTSSLVLKAFGYRPDDRLYSGLSLTHSNALVATLGASLIGGLPAVFSRRFTRTRLWDITRKYGCTSFTLLGGMTTALYAQPPMPDDKGNPVRFVVSAGMPAVLWEDFERRFGLQILEFYGSAEGGLAFKPIGMGPVGSFGKLATRFVHRIVDDEGVDVPKGQPGELLIRAADGTPASVEYVNNPEASALKNAGGWLHTGDVVHEDAEGWMFFDYRKGGGIRRNGDFISPAYVEKAIADSGQVRDVFVYGIPATSGAPGEKEVVAAVVPADVASFDPRAIYSCCRVRLESNFVPSFLQVVSEIPKTASEKPQEKPLAEAFTPDARNVHVEHRAEGSPLTQRSVITESAIP